jgi:hypothetical protein
MKCPRCGNELTPEEAFCGQCGTPTSVPPPVQPTEMVGLPSLRSGLLGPYNATTPFTPAQSNGYRPETPLLPWTQNTRMPSSPSAQSAPNPTTKHLSSVTTQDHILIA